MAGFDLGTVSQEILLALDGCLMQRGEFRVVAEGIEQWVLVHGGIGTVVTLDSLAQLAEGSIALFAGFRQKSGITQHVTHSVMRQRDIGTTAQKVGSLIVGAVKISLLNTNRGRRTLSRGPGCCSACFVLATEDKTCRLRPQERYKLPCDARRDAV